MKTVKILTLGLCALTITLVTSCGNNKQHTTENTEQKVVENDSVSMTSKYSGILPAADCPGIRTTLVLKWTKMDTVKNSFELTEEYIDRKTFTSSGNFNTERGFGDDNDATVIILNYDKPQREQRYYVWFSKNPKIMHALSPAKELNKNTALNYTLERVEFK